ncbi:GNAT family N-acetyltransferase [Methanoculleus oceani]|uniref:GNAT family N-acetyltransferase n=1 Tax=Methanoculleus oceani TaxID=2184756 RepID=UPI0020335984|nr:GNAT family N-acetyltransferase [Methanoculleus sp. CWC-02]
MRYYLILNEQEVVGISPWAERSALNFLGLVSIPHSEMNGIVLDDTFNADHFNEILSLFAKKYSFLHFNTCNPALLDGIRFTHVSGEDTGHMMTDLRSSPPDAIWAGLSKRTKQALRTFENDGFEVSEINHPDELDDFYRYYSGNMTHINGKILPLAFFEKLLEQFPDEIRVTALTRNDLFAGGSLALLDPARKIYYGNYLAINRDLPNRYTPSYHIMWESINWAWKNGYEKLSSGRQKLEPGNPRFRYKAKFGAEHLPIHSNLVLLSKPMLVSYKIREMLLTNRGA